MKSSAPWKQRDDKIYEHLPSPRTYFRACVCIHAGIYMLVCMYIRLRLHVLNWTPRSEGVWGSGG